MATKLPDDLMLRPLGGEARELGDWLTTFHLASVVLDPYTNESSWILKTAVRILEEFRGSHARVNFVVTADDVALAFLYLALAPSTTAAVLTVDGGNIAASPR